jgi:glutamate/tyrosine decarboxylase-like PLP-dependent enzyme
MTTDAGATVRKGLDVAVLRDAFEEVRHSVESGAIYPNVTADEVEAYLAEHYDFKSALEIEEVIADVQEMLAKWQVQVTHPHYFGLFNPSVGLASVAADAITAMYNPQLANWRTSPAANGIERYTLRWLSKKFGLPPESEASFTSGGTEANLSAMVVALTRSFPGYDMGGVRAIDGTPALYVTRESHNGYNKLAHITGIGRQALRMVEIDEKLRMNVGDLSRKIAEDRRRGMAPFMVVGTAGTTATGVIDPLSEIGELCEQEGLWFHADAAWGGAAVLSPALRHHLAGIERADSITCDAHKWLSVAMGSGMFFCRHPESVAQAFRAQTTYMPGEQKGAAADPLLMSVQWSRRFIGLKLFMVLAEKGEGGYAQMIERQTALGQLLRELLLDSGWRVVNETPLPLVCFVRDGVDSRRILERLRERQTAWMSLAEVSGIAAIRACITSFRTTPEDIRMVVEELNRIVDEAARS